MTDIQYLQIVKEHGSKGLALGVNVTYAKLFLKKGLVTKSEEIRKNRKFSRIFITKNGIEWLHKMDFKS